MTGTYLLEGRSVRLLVRVHDIFDVAEEREESISRNLSLSLRFGPHPFRTVSSQRLGEEK